MPEQEHPFKEGAARRVFTTDDDCSLCEGTTDGGAAWVRLMFDDLDGRTTEFVLCAPCLRALVKIAGGDGDIARGDPRDGTRGDPSGALRESFEAARKRSSDLFGFLVYLIARVYPELDGFACSYDPDPGDVRRAGARVKRVYAALEAALALAGEAIGQAMELPKRIPIETRADRAERDEERREIEALRARLDAIRKEHPPVPPEKLALTDNEREAEGR